MDPWGTYAPWEGHGFLAWGLKNHQLGQWVKTHGYWLPPMGFWLGHGYGRWLIWDDFLVRSRSQG